MRQIDKAPGFSGNGHPFRQATEGKRPENGSHPTKHPTSKRRTPNRIPRGSIDARQFWSRVDGSGGRDACWPWKDAATADGYGRYKIDGKLYLPHRIAYALAHVEPCRAIVRHSCDKPPCCNPRHLIKGTYADNVADMDARGRRKPCRGEAHPRAVVSDATIAAIRSDRRSSRKAAPDYGVTPGYVRQVRRGEARSAVAQ